MKNPKQTNKKRAEHDPPLPFDDALRKILAAPPTAQDYQEERRKEEVKPGGFRLRGALAEIEHEQEQRELYLPVAQLQFDRQRNHWREPLTMLAGPPTVEVGICRAPCRALALGLPRIARSVGLALYASLSLCPRARNGRGAKGESPFGGRPPTA